MPVTQPFTSSALDLTSKPPPCLGPNSTAQLVSTFFGGLPALARPLESAMLKQLACAAARSSSGVVWFGAPSVRAFQLRFASLNVPLCALVRPLPDMRSPSQDAVARLCICFLLLGGRRFYTAGGGWQEALTEHRFRCMDRRVRPVSNPPNPWLSTEVEYLEEIPDAKLEVYEDHTREILASNDSPDVGFSWSVNPYRGCFHSCAYCYARPTHEYLGLGAGTDFDRKITVKPDAPRLLREAFERPSWKGELIVFSGVTDCYQPLEASYRLTRGCLQVCADYHNPAGIITKAALIERDLDVLERLRREARVGVTVSIPIWNPEHARALEPFVATPARRMKTIERLAAA